MGPGWVNAARVVATCLTVLAVATNLAVAPVVFAGGRSAATAACIADTEPNDSEDLVQDLTTPSCIDGTLPANDQDLFLWTVDDSQRGQRWTISVDGVRDTETDLRIFATSSDPGVTPVVAGGQLFVVGAAPASGRARAQDLLFTPGRYLVGISRSGTRDGGEPTTFDYRVTFAAGTENPPADDREPNDDVKRATPVAGAFAASGNLKDSEDYLAWTISPQDEQQRWHVSVQSEIQGSVALMLEKPSGDELVRAYLGVDGRAEFRDLSLAAGTYVLHLGYASTGPLPWILIASPETGPLADPEPNDNRERATPLDPSHLVATGRLAAAGDVDDYLLHVDDQLATVLLDLKLIWQGGPGRQLCLIDSTDTQLLCRSGDGGDAMANLFLPVGDYRLEIRGDPDPDSFYVLRVDQTSEPAPDFELEPNDTAVAASPWIAGVAMRGRQEAGDVDYFRLTVSGAPQLWQLTASGDHVNGVSWYRRDGTSLASAEVAADQHSASVEDMYLIPGDHWIRVDAVGDYSLALTPEGPPDPNGEREPNNDSLNAQPLALGVPRTGRLPRNNDIDISRFTLTAPERLHLTITPPSDGGVTWGIYQRGNAEMARERTVDLGVPISEDLSLPAGDYELWLYPGPISRGIYTVELDREDPFEPTTDLAATVDVSTETDEVAAYWQAGQQVHGQVTITNTGSSSETLSLDAVTSHYAWTVSLDRDQVEIAAGDTVTVPIEITIEPDAWADDPVRISVRSRDASGAQAIGHAELKPGVVVAPVNPLHVWSVPTELLGGLDVAATALGAQPVPAYDPTYEALLYDGLTPAGAGFSTSIAALPITLTTDLAGDDPVSVAGMILNPQAALADIVEAPKQVELWLSDDGATWTEATSGELSPLPIDQSFVLPSAMNARYAQLRITSMWKEDASTVALGEFKVIATPGTSPSSSPLNLADAALGGHLVYLDPQSPSEDTPYTALDEDLTPNWIDVQADEKPSWVLAFRDDRAAQLTSLEWVDPTGSDPGSRDKIVSIQTSLDSPLGPWQDQGTWQLKRADDGTVAPFTFSAPTWARYVRFTADAPKQEQNRELPGVLRAIESPTSESYRSVFAEYGATQSGDYEIQNPPPVDAPTYAPDGNDTPDAATPLEADLTTDGTAHTAEDVDWFDVAVPDGQNTLTFTLHGAPSVGVSLVLQDAGGGSIPMEYKPGDDPGSVTYSATVTPGQHYHVEVQQPPFSTVFTYDTSGSMGSYLGFVYGAVRSFAADVVPGRQAVRIVPFEEDSVLPEWSDDKFALEDAVEGVVNGGGSSSAETALLNASELLAPREGAKAVLLVTDAETTSFDRAAELWQRFEQQRPQVFAVHVGADTTLQRSGHYMQDWAVSSGGFYQYTSTHEEMDRAFERMATWLERPTEYQLSYQTTFVAPPKPSTKPGTLQVLGPTQINGQPAPVPVGSGVAVEVILDTSGSMLTPISGSTRRIDAAKTVLDDLLRTGLPTDTPVALRVLGNATKPCGTDLVVPLAPLAPEPMTQLVDGIDVVQVADTPIAQAINAVPLDLKAATGTKVLILITDSQEIWPNPDLCGKDPTAAIRALVKKGIDARVNIVGLAVNDRRARQNLSRLAHAGNGVFYSATNAAELAAAVEQAIHAPFQVFDADGKQVGSGVVGGPPVSLKPGVYHVVVLTDPQVEFDAVVKAEESLVLTLPTSQ